MGINPAWASGGRGQIMARYTTLPFTLNAETVQQMYREIQRWGSVLVNDLDSRDMEIDSKPSTNIYRVVTVTSIGRPRKGDIAYSVSTGKFKGYVSSGSTTEWQDLN